MLSQKKETKEKATPYRLFPVLLSLLGGKLKLAALRQSLAEIPIKLALLGAVAGEFKVKPKVKTEFKIASHSREAGMTLAFCHFPLRHAEQRRYKGGFSKRLFELKASFRLLPLCRVAQGSRRPWCWGAVLFGYFLFRQLKESD